jgi:hypothetical protein
MPASGRLDGSDTVEPPSRLRERFGSGKTVTRRARISNSSRGVTIGNGGSHGRRPPGASLPRSFEGADNPLAGLRGRAMSVGSVLSGKALPTGGLEENQDDPTPIPGSSRMGSRVNRSDRARLIALGPGRGQFHPRLDRRHLGRCVRGLSMCQNSRRRMASRFPGNTRATRSSPQGRWRVAATRHSRPWQFCRPRHPSSRLADVSTITTSTSAPTTRTS